MNTQPKVIMCFGHTQTGKSSFIKLMTGNQTIKCGEFGVGKSTTSDIRAYKDVTKKHPSLKNSYVYIDSIGLGDNSLQYNLKSFNNHIEMNLLQLSRQTNISQISAIVITETYFSSSFTLPLIFQQIGQIFGYFPRQGVIILGTKKNTSMGGANGKAAEIRKNQLLKIMDDFSIPRTQFIDFYTPCPEIDFLDIPNSQFAEFETAVTGCKPVVMTSITQKQEAIRQRALQIQAQNTKQKAIKVDEQRVKYRTQKRPREIQVPREKRRGGVAGLLGGTKVVWDTKTIYEDFQVPETYTVQVDKYMPDVPPYEYCFAKAFDEFENENMKKLGSLLK